VRSNFVVAITFPRLLGAFKPQGAFGWYAGWNIIGFFAVLLYVPETKALSLEELDQGKQLPLPLFGKTFLFTHPFSLFGVDADTCGISNQGTAVQHQEIHLPQESRPYAATLRTRGCHRGETLCPRWRRPRMSICTVYGDA
jgi:Sugar (and other) transporter